MGSMAQGRDGQSGFTLMELVVVVIILGVLAGAITPLFRASVTWVRGNRVTRDLVGTVRFATEMAIVEGVEYRLCIDTREHAYWLERLERFEQDKKVFEALTGPEGRRQILPETVRFDHVDAGQGPEPGIKAISFYPGGSSDFATIRMKTPDRGRTEIDLRGGLSRMKVDET